MTTCFLAPDPIQSTQFIPGGNTPANGGQLFFYIAGSSTKATVYKDSAAASAWTNPIVLDSGGNLPSGGEVWFPTGQTFKVVFAPSTDTDPPASPYWTKDNLAGMNDVSVTAQSEWVAGPTPTFVSTTQFTLSGDQTGTFTVGRRVKTSNTGGTVYGVITSVSFSANTTTVNIVTDSGNLDSGLSAVFYGILDPANPSVASPEIFRKGSNVASAGNGTTNIWGSIGDYVHVTGTNNIAFFSTAPYSGAFKDLVFDGALVLLSSSAMTINGSANVSTAANDRARVRADTVSTYTVEFLRQSGAPNVPLQFSAFTSYVFSTIRNSLTTNVALSTATQYFTGPQVAQGTTGTWLAMGQVTCDDSLSSGVYDVQLTDGTTTVAAGEMRDSGQGNRAMLSLSGVFVNPAGNIAIQAKDRISSGGRLLYNGSGTSTDSTINVVRIG